MPRRTLREITGLLASIDRGFRSLVRMLGSGAPPRRGPLKLSPQRKATLKLQGKYMAYVRQLSPPQKRRVKALKTRKGFPAAIALARKLAK